MQEQLENLSELSRNQSIDKPGLQESINMDGKSINMSLNHIISTRIKLNKDMVL